MTAPSTYLRQLREGAANRRLELARILRDTPDATNLELAAALNVNRDTIAEDRKALMELVTSETSSEMQQLREDLRQKLEALEAEVQKHRKEDGRLSHVAIDQLLSITKAVIELTGARKPVKEQVEMSGNMPLNVIVKGRVATRIPVIQGEPVEELTPGQQRLTEGKDE
jgi:hypothetical protein